MDLSPEARAQAVEELEALPFLDRVVAASGKFLGTPYLESPLGEGEGPDPDPQERYDAVDCLTFVEETLALSLASSAEEVPAILSDVRYGSWPPPGQERRDAVGCLTFVEETLALSVATSGEEVPAILSEICYGSEPRYGDRNHLMEKDAFEPRYEDRNHLMEAEWIPNNVQKGFVRDVTLRHAGTDAEWTQKVITKETWTSVSSRALGLPEPRQLTGTFPFPILPLAKVMAHARELPSGTILLVVREDLALKATRITHLGFIVQERRRTRLRHAARNTYARVVDEDLETFLARNSRYAKWKVSGVALLEPLPRPAGDGRGDRQLFGTEVDGQASTEK
jgi:hypothetical protein